MNERPPQSAAFAYLLIAAPVQFFGTWLAMVAYPDAAWAKAVFAAAKVTLMLLPVVWLLRVERVRPRLPRWSHRGMLAAHLSGVVIVVVIAAAYAGFARHWIDRDALIAQVTAGGLATPVLYLAGAFYWCTINSLLEEYFWRWFVGERLRDVLPGGRRTRVADLAACVLSALLFTAHHVVALLMLVDARTAALGSAGVFAGGLIWSLLYLRYRNVWACWVSHVYADLIIFYLGWRLIFG